MYKFGSTMSPSVPHRDVLRGVRVDSCWGVKNPSRLRSSLKRAPAFYLLLLLPPISALGNILKELPERQTLYLQQVIAPRSNFLGADLIFCFSILRLSLFLSLFQVLQPLIQWDPGIFWKNFWYDTTIFLILFFSLSRMYTKRPVYSLCLSKI